MLAGVKIDRSHVVSTDTRDSVEFCFRCLTFFKRTIKVFFNLEEVSRGHVVLTDWDDSVPGGSASTQASQHGVGRQESSHRPCRRRL